MAHVREGRAAADSLPPNETQLRLSDGVYAFDIGALASGVTVRNLDYDEVAMDAGLKYRGFTFQGEYYVRRLSNFDATGPVPMDVDRSTRASSCRPMHMVVPKYVGVYAIDRATCGTTSSGIPGRSPAASASTRPAPGAGGSTST